MSDTLQGMPTTAQIITYCDGLATIFKNDHAAFAQLLSDIQTFRGIVQGDGTNPSIGHALLEQYTQAHLSTLVQSGRFEKFFKTGCFPLIQDLNNVITASLPMGWTMGGLFPLDGWLSRLNGNAVGTPATPSNQMVLTAATTPGGALSTVAVGSAPRVTYTYVGANSMLESLPATQSSQVALAGSQNSYTGTITGNVPAGVYFINVYRGVNGGSANVYYLDQTIAVTPGALHPTITIQKPDALLQTTINPPVWMSCPMTPEFAYLFGLISSTASPVRSTDTAPYQLTSQGMMSATNVLLAPTSGWLGIGNAVTTGQFGTRIFPAAYVAGSINTINVPANNTQGFFGATKLQARASTQLNGTYTPTISYTYIDATHSTPQTQTGVTPVSNFAGGIPNETVVFTITAGRVVLSVTETATGGTATTGTVVYEGAFPRSY